MERLNQIRADLKQQQKEIRRIKSLKNKADRFVKKIQEMEMRDPVMFYYYRTTFIPTYEGFCSNIAITNKEYYLALFEYLEESSDAYSVGMWFDIKQTKRYSLFGCSTIRPTLQELIDLCELFDIPFDKNVLTETYNENAYIETAYTCDICYDEMPLINDNMKDNFRRFKKWNLELKDWINSCNCKILVCSGCCNNINPKCCPLCRTPFQVTIGINENEIIRIEQKL